MLTLILIILLTIIIGIFLFLQHPQFGRNPKGHRFERIKKSSNYHEGKFQNLHFTPQLTEKITTIISENLLKKIDQRKPKKEIPSVKTNIHQINPDENILIWFGHSSYYIQLNGKRCLIDPVFSGAGSPVPFFNRSFKGSDIYTADNIPDLDYLIITHDHYDHLDYPTIKKLKNRIKKVVCPLGVGEHFERWKFEPSRLIELDWNESSLQEPDFEIHCLPAHHFSGRGLSMKQTLWASFLLKTPAFKIFIGGDGGYQSHFAEIGERFGPIDLAILENGQYNKDWKYIHMQPNETLKAAKDLRTRILFPVHNSKFALSNHPWYEPLQKISSLHNDKDFVLITPLIGEKVNLNKKEHTYEHWWEKV